MVNVTGPQAVYTKQPGSTPPRRGGPPGWRIFITRGPRCGLRAGSPNGSRPTLPTVQRPNVNLCSGLGSNWLFIVLPLKSFFLGEKKSLRLRNPTYSDSCSIYILVRPRNNWDTKLYLVKETSDATFGLYTGRHQILLAA